jgi:hypothetical protein
VTLAKDLKITQKSAWFMLHRLRHGRPRQFVQCTAQGRY